MRRVASASRFSFFHLFLHVRTILHTLRHREEGDRFDEKIDPPGSSNAISTCSKFRDTRTGMQNPLPNPNPEPLCLVL